MFSFAENQLSLEDLKLEQEFDLGFLGLNGAIDTEVAQALLFGKNDITKIPTSARYLTDKKNGAALYSQAQKVMKVAWDREMRREGVKYFSGNYTEDHPPTLLKNTDAAVVGRFTEAFAPDIRALFEAAMSAPEGDAAKLNFEDGQGGRIFRRSATVFSGMNEALEAKAEALDATTEDMTAEASAAAAALAGVSFSPSRVIGMLNVTVGLSCASLCVPVI